VGVQGVKAKWVRVELKKVETLPGGGQTNSYFDFVGQGPLNLWQSTEEYGLLQSVSGASPCGDRRKVMISSLWMAIARPPISDPYT
jgi:hypothetical protein